jgi:hypothetical protein
MKKPRTQKRMSDEAVKARTGKVWAEWFEILDQAGAKSRHTSPIRTKWDRGGPK